MSVINKMLRDLDQRQAQAASATTAATQPIGSGTLPRHAGAAHGAARGGGGAHAARRAMLGLSAAVLLAAGAGWLWHSRTPSSAPPAEAQLVAATLPARAPEVQAAPPLQPVASSPVRARAAEPVAAATPPPAAPRTEIPPEAATQAAKPRATASALARDIPATLGLRMDGNLSPRKPAERPVTPERAATSPKPNTPPSGMAANDALERAQTLWNGGSRDAAIDLLQDAVAVAERQGGASNSPQGNPVLLPVVRELTRMQLAEARHSAVWELLTRLESQLGSAPDLWAIRANAAQRLGRHQDSVHAYLVALQSRPTEQRWLLGAAVSLAALGQTSGAAEMADKARAVGTVSPEVLAYLRQMGVSLKDK